MHQQSLPTTLGLDPDLDRCFTLHYPPLLLPRLPAAALPPPLCDHPLSPGSGSAAPIPTPTSHKTAKQQRKIKNMIIIEKWDFDPTLELRGVEK